MRTADATEKRKDSGEGEERRAEGGVVRDRKSLGVASFGE